MISSLGVLLVVFAELIFLIGFIIWVIYLTYSAFYGSPYVGTKKRLVETILKEADLKKGMRMLELGCGDGRMLATAVREFKVNGIGIDINPLLIKLARRKWKHIPKSTLEFRVGNIRDAINFSAFDVVYIYLMPKFIKELAPRLAKGLNKKSLVISHTFKIPGWEKHRIKTVDTSPTETYYYRI